MLVFWVFFGGSFDGRGEVDGEMGERERGGRKLTLCVGDFVEGECDICVL